jgi:hypothetical protein
MTANIEKALERLRGIDKTQMDRAFKLGILYAAVYAEDIDDPAVQLFGKKLNQFSDAMLKEFKDTHGAW